MDWLEHHLSIFPAPDLVLVVGAGQGRDLPALTRRTGARLVLLEPQPRLADTLSRHTEHLPGAQVLEYALDDQSGTGVMAVYNFPELSSLRPDPALESLMPGARQTAQLPVETRTLSDLVQELDLPMGADNWLIVDAPGMESAILASLEDRDLRRRFGHVILRTNQRVLEGAETDAGPLLRAFLSRGYRLLGEEDRSDGDWPRLHVQYFNRSPQRLELEAKVAALKQRSKDLAVEKNELQERLERQSVELEDRMSKLDEELRSVNRDAEQRLTALAADLEQSKQALQQQKDHEAKAAELSEQLTQATTTLDERQAELDQRAAEAQERDASMQAQETRVTELTEQLTQATTTLEERQAELDRRVAEAQERDEAQQAQEARIAELTEQLTQATTTLQERQAEFERRDAQARELEQAQTVLESTIQDLEGKLAASTDDLEKLQKLEEKRSLELVRLQSYEGQTSSREAALSQEIARAEAQLDLIKDVLRER